jgi:FAD/FMN-containing dehydrogenase
MPITTNEQRRIKERRIAAWPPSGDKLYRKLGATREELAQLQMQFQGTIVLPTDPDYDKDRQGNPLYPEYPKIILYCQVFSDVALALRWAHSKPDWVVTCRSGGHSTAGFSVNNGMVLDVSRLNHVLVDKDSMTMTVGAGANWGDVIKELDANQVHTVTGGCPDVGIAGFVQGGGYGFTSLMFGMSSDNVLAMKVMLQDGSTVIATSENDHAPLFWAMRGGTGNNFGVLLEVVFRLYAKNIFWGFGIRWSLDDAPAALALMQKQYMKSAVPQKLGYQTVIATLKDGNQALAMFGMYDGMITQGLEVLDPLLSATGGQLFVSQVQSYGYLNEHLLDDNLFPPPTDGGLIEFKKSGYIARLMSPSDWRPVIEYFKTTTNKYNIIGIEPYGGGINAISPDASAFIHRNVYMDFFVDSFFFKSGRPTSRKQAQEWLDGLMNLMAGNFNERMYQNYPVRDNPNFASAYWDTKTYSLLRAIKTRYDPDNFFRFEQSIPPLTSTRSIKRVNDPAFVKQFQKKAG